MQSSLGGKTSLTKILSDYRAITQTNRDSGTLFEDLMVIYFKNEPKFKEQYRGVMPYGRWVGLYGYELGIDSKKDTGIDLVATTFTGEHHAIQCKNYEATKSIGKSDIDSFMSASSKNYFSYRIIVATTNHWTDNAIAMLDNQTPPVSIITINELERSSIDWDQYYTQKTVAFLPKKELRPHQITARNEVVKRLQEADRGKLIMACGSGKTFTSLKIAESMAGKGKRVLFLVPSLALLSQSLNEWSQESSIPLRNFAVCSDSDVGKNHQKSNDDLVIATQSDLDYPATTNAEQLARTLETLHDNDHMTVVFSTYHSIRVISDAQLTHKMGEFDLIICDEAHRTTGATFEGEDESAFVAVHNNDNVMGKKRLYMTATHRIYGEQAKTVASVQLCSMDDETLYGKDLYVISFSEAVALGLLVDYKVVVLAVEEGDINRQLQRVLTNENNELNVSDAAKIVGCWKALTKYGLSESKDGYNPMQRAVAFCQIIEKDYKGNKHKVSSKLISDMFSEVVSEYQKFEIAELLKKDPNAVIPDHLLLACECEHVDGGMNASEKQSKIDWLKKELPDNTCHILSNVRCLSEGVDVPSLDAVMFLTPRQSQIDVVQSVGRVMRLAEGKKLGYVILPVVIPAGVEPDVALNDNEVYKVVWQVLNALRSHDDRFDAMINKLSFDGKDTSKMEVIAVSNTVNPKSKAKGSKVSKAAKSGNSIGKKLPSPKQGSQLGFSFEVGAIERALYAKIVDKCGDRDYWDRWVDDIARIANTHIDRISAVLENPENTVQIQAFKQFASELRGDLNNSISDDEVVEMLAQHLVTKPVFDAMFEEYDFVKSNNISQAMERVLSTLENQHLEKETKQLNDFYLSVRKRAQGTQTPQGKQKIIKDLYDNFFQKAFPKMAKRLGIVYTPNEVIDFIIHSVENVLNDEFGASMADKGVHIIDPFTGTGSFITQLMQSGIIPPDKLSYKYQNEIHANEIVLLAYYIACINIEAVYHTLIIDDYTPFNGICLTDTFEMYEKGDLIGDILEDNSGRRRRQKELDIRVIIGNPPYSAGQESANDNNANIAYPSLDAQIRDTYAKHSVVTNKNSLYDSYIRAIRWASDRIGNQGVIGFVTNAGFIDSNSADGMRKCLADEFSNLYIFNLKGAIRGKSGVKAKLEGQNVFDIMTGVAISILVKNPQAKQTGNVQFYDIGEHLNREQKLEKIAGLKDIKGIQTIEGWQQVIPNEFGDWLNQRDLSFNNHIVLGDKKNKDSVFVFENYSRGLATSRDAWVYNFSQNQLTQNVKKSINFYNSEVKRYIDQGSDLSADEFVIFDSTKFSWSRANKLDLEKHRIYNFNSKGCYTALYRPFTKAHSYFNKNMNDMTYQLPRLFPTAHAENKLICVTLSGSKGFSITITNLLPDLHLIGDCQCFPLYLYEEKQSDSSKGELSDESDFTKQYERKHAITDQGLDHFADYYNQVISKENLFYYIYGLLHSTEYREKFADSLSKQLPRIPRVKSFDDFMAFSKAGRELAEIHLNYETVDMYMGVNFETNLTNLKLATPQQWVKSKLDDGDFYVRQMKHPKIKNPNTGKAENDLTKIIYNGHITVAGIPVEAYDYVVNGKPAIEWVIERQAVTTDKDSGITNDANDWANETMGNPRYPLELLLRVINVSLQTSKLVSGLPKLEIE